MVLVLIKKEVLQTEVLLDAKITYSTLFAYKGSKFLQDTVVEHGSKIGGGGGGPGKLSYTIEVSQLYNVFCLRHSLRQNKLECLSMVRLQDYGDWGSLRFAILRTALQNILLTKFMIFCDKPAFFPGSPFLPRLIFVGRARRLP
jgi:hypothetical protein